jgi:hypothetical protein
MTTTKTATIIPANLGNDPAANLAFFLMENTGSPLGCWTGRLPAADQRKLMGKFLGKGVLSIKGIDETVSHTRKVAFGMDWDTETVSWRELGMKVAV